MEYKTKHLNTKKTNNNIKVIKMIVKDLIDLKYAIQYDKEINIDHEKFYINTGIIYNDIDIMNISCVNCTHNNMQNKDCKTTDDLCLCKVINDTLCKNRNI